MKNTLQLFALIFTMTLCTMCRAQLVTSFNLKEVAYLNSNNVNAGIGIGGNPFTFFGDTNTVPSGIAQLLEVPKGSGRTPVFTSALWMSGLDAGNNLHLAANEYNEQGYDFFDGPIDANYSAQYDTFYHRVFKVTQAQIAHFRSFPAPVPVSQIDSNIWKWPAKGNPFVASNFGVNIASNLAPFADVDGDGIYSPANGDYPLINGDEAIFFVFNDARNLHTETNGLSLGMEIRGLAEVFTDSSSNAPFEKRALNNTVFISYEIENKSADNYHDFYFSFFEDPDIGCADNDRVGCDSSKKLMFAYNGTTPDSGCLGALGYTPYQAAHGVKMLNQYMSSFTYFDNGAAPGKSDPINAQQYRNYQAGFWADGTPFTEGGNAYDSLGTPARFVFPGDPNDTTTWSEIQPGVNLSYGDRRMVSSAGPMYFNAGETKCFDFAFITSYDSTGAMYGMVDTLKRDADAVQLFYDNNLIGCASRQITGIKEANDNSLKISLFPNPATDELNIFYPNNFSPENIRIFSAEGKLVNEIKQPASTVLDISQLAKGVYITEFISHGMTARARFVKM